MGYLATYVKRLHNNRNSVHQYDMLNVQKNELHLQLLELLWNEPYRKFYEQVIFVL